MKIYSFNAPNNKIFTDKIPSVNFNKITYISEGEFNNIISKIDKILNYYDQYKDFTYMPIIIEYKNLVPKTSRIRNIFKCDNKILKKYFQNILLILMESVLLTLHINVHKRILKIQLI